MKKKIRILGEKEIYKYVGILEVDTNKQVEMKEKKSISDYRENFSNSSSAAGILLKGIFETILEMDEGRTSTKEAENKKVSDDA